MSISQHNIYRFASFELNSAERTLRRSGEPLQIAPRVFDTLHLLVRNNGHILSKERLLDEVWEGSFVEENNLAQNISMLRKLLGDTGGSKFIETVPKFGYRFIAPVEIGEVENEPGGKNAPATGQGMGSGTQEGSPASGTFHTGPKPDTRYVQNGDVNIAYQVLGDGEIDLVFVMGWVSHMEYFWEEPHFASFLQKLASFSRLILFDKRGTGLSDRVPLSELPTLEQRMEDVHAVMDAVGSERAVLIGVSEGGPMCSLFAATYPERTAGVVMIGTYAKRIRDDDYPWGVSSEDRDAFFDLMMRDWGKPVGIEERAPSLAGDAEFREWWATYLRMGASPGAAVALTKMNAEIDVRSVLPSIRVPSLVIHRRGDLCLKVEEGRYVASKIPGCKYLELDGIDHLPFVGEQGEILDAIEGFLADVQEKHEYDRVLATVLGVVLSAEAGPETLGKLRDQIRRQIGLFKGTEVNAGETELLATFDGPARAIRCAASINSVGDRRGWPVGTGLHTGECDHFQGNYSGFAVELARRIASSAMPGETVVSRTVKDLVAGSGLTFEDIGVASFEGIEGGWRLFKVAG
ncbi:MAG: alpha/beta fold hydrolase [Chloracidobacterium sp.]|nr:alpha/beta fold hydrolase [Chloracidobacterium sp.]